MATILDSYMPYDSGPGANVSEDGWRQFAKYFSGDGIKRGIANGFNVFGDSTGMQVKVDTGECTIQGQWGKNSSVKTLPIASNASGANRIDLVILRNDFVNNRIEADVLTGSSSTSPPSLTQSSTKWEIQLGIVTVPNGAATIASGNVQFIPQVADYNLGGQNRTVTLTNITGEELVVATPIFALASNTAYRVIFTLRGSATTGEEVRANVYKGTNAGTLIAGQDFGANTGLHLATTCQGVYTTTSPENAQFSAYVTRHEGGTNVISASNNGTNIFVEQVGPASIITNATNAT